MGAEVLGSRAVLAALANRLDVGPTGWTNAVGMMFQSNQEIEEYKWLGKSPAMREWRGNRIAAQLRDNGVSVKNLPYESTIDVPEDHMRRDKFGQVRRRINQLSQRANSHWAKLVSALINAGTTGLAYDGQYFFDTDHSEGYSGTQSNKLSASNYADLNVDTATLPTAGEMALIMVAGMTHFHTLLDDQGEPINEDAMSFLVMVPPKMLGVAQVAIAANLLNQAGAAIDNPAKVANATFTAVGNARLTGTSVVTMYRTDAEDKPFILQEDKPVRASAKAEGSEFLHDTGHMQFGVDASRAAGYGIWQYAMHMTLS